jgi:hypothetical protein
MPQLTELNWHHEVLVRQVLDFARDAGWRDVPVTYHSQEGSDVLQLANDPTAVFIRTRPDLHLTNGRRALLVEVKTCISSQYANATPELFPIVAALIHWHVLGVRTLYVYEDPHAGISAAWWAYQVFEDVPVAAIYVGTQRPEWREYMAWIHRWKSISVIPADVPVKTVRTNGSGDPYVVIPERVLRNLLPWHVVLGDALRN